MVFKLINAMIEIISATCIRSSLSSEVIELDLMFSDSTLSIQDPVDKDNDIGKSDFSMVKLTFHQAYLQLCRVIYDYIPFIPKPGKKRFVC